MWSASYKAPHYTVFSTVLLFPPLLVQMFPLVHIQVWHKYITCSIALWISFGLRAWAWGKHDSASSAAARTILRSQPREALSAMLTASGGVRCPSQVSMRKEMAGAPISIAWPVLTYTYLSYSNKTITTIMITSNSYSNWHRAVGIVTTLCDGQYGAWIPVGQEILLFSKLSRLALGPTQPPIQFVLGVKQLGHEVNHSPPLVLRVKNEWSCTSTFLICLHGVDKENFTFFWLLSLLWLFHKITI